MSLWGWLLNALNSLGVRFQKHAKVLFLGLDNAGKSTLLHMLKSDTMAQHVPTLHPTSEELYFGNTRFTTFDLGAHTQVRRVWQDYFPAIDAIVFLIDVSDRERFPEVKRELNFLLTDERLTNCPVLILGNKIDQPSAASEDEVREYFKLQTYGQQAMKDYAGSQLRVRPLEFFTCSLLKRQGYGAGFTWLTQQL